MGNVRLHLPVGGQLQDLVHVLSRELRLVLVEAAHADTDRGRTFDQQVIGLGKGGATAGESEDQEARTPIDAAHRFVEDVAADRIVNHVGTAAAGERLYLVAKSAFTVVDQVIGAVFAHDLELVVATGGGDHRGPHQLCELHGGETDAARGAMDQHGLTGLEPRALNERVIGGRISGGKASRLREAQILRHRQDGARIDHRPFAEWSVPVSGNYLVTPCNSTNAVADRLYRSRRLHSGDEGRLGLELIFARNHQHVDELHAGRGDPDLHLPGAGSTGLREVFDNEAIG